MKAAKKTKAAVKKKALAPNKKRNPAKASKKRNPVVKKPTKKAAKKTRKKGDTLMCFLTTACVRYFHLADNGYELNTLRRYRDSYLASSEKGRELIKHYYQVSPEIVKRLEKDEQRSSLYAYIHNRVLKACTEIDRNEFEKAKYTYQRMVVRLQKHYELYLS